VRHACTWPAGSITQLERRTKDALFFNWLAGRFRREKRRCEARPACRDRPVNPCGGLSPEESRWTWRMLCPC
jgi:hypothetical protein